MIKEKQFAKVTFHACAVDALEALAALLVGHAGLVLDVAGGDGVDGDKGQQSDEEKETSHFQR